MYVIYVNDRPLTLLSSTHPGTRVRAQETAAVATHLTARYVGKPRTLLHYTDMLEKGSPKVTSVDVVGPDLEQLWADFRSKFRWVEAAGGVVRHRASGKTLFIYRRGTWDLPKGKLDTGENAPSAALREVEEETGVSDLSLGEQLMTTYHTYRDRKDRRVLKPTYWFRMSSRQDELTPEAGEGIERAQWRTTGEVLAPATPLYASLRHLLEHTVS